MPNLEWKCFSISIELAKKEQAKGIAAAVVYNVKPNQEKNYRGDFGTPSQGRT